MKIGWSSLWQVCISLFFVLTGVAFFLSWTVPPVVMGLLALVGGLVWFLVVVGVLRDG